MKPKLLFCCAGLVFAQTPQFEVASVKASGPITGRPPYSITDSRVELGFMPLSGLIQMAYRIEPFQLVGPDWLSTTRFDIVATLPAGSSKDKVPQMLQALLEDRFKLAVHHELRPEQVYTLTVAKTGAKMKEPSADNQIDPVFMKGRNILRRTATESGDGFFTESAAPGTSPDRVLDAPRITMQEFAKVLKQWTDRPVVDSTALPGFFHVTIQVPRPQQNSARAPVSPAPTGEASDPDVSIFSSVQKLGLALEKGTTPLDYLVIDRIEKVPSEN